MADLTLDTDLLRGLVAARLIGAGKVGDLFVHCGNRPQKASEITTATTREVLSEVAAYLDELRSESLAHVNDATGRSRETLLGIAMGAREIAKKIRQAMAELK